ncbi:patatin family protein [Candidatus Woesearchaeota archaeon]|jgi:NTE family protein|nr:patatin family protein [Candidatus Woesearchaeota archaeon]MBT4631054.1 patatin family protein [Candidatus Woesearchaeota archaeon]
MKKVGLALGGGTAKGLAHIGILEVLEKNNIKIDYLSGTSMGAVVAALYSSGMPIKDLKKIALTTKWENLVDFTLPDKGILSGDKIETFLRVLLKNKKFKDLRIPLRVVAADVYKGEKVIFKKGDVASSLRASISLPSIFVPHEYNGRVLVDGGVVDPVPVDIVKSMGADIVIAVDLSVPLKDVIVSSKTEKSKKFLKKIEKKMIEQEIEEINKYVAKKKNLPWIIKNILEHPEKIVGFFKRHKLKGPKLLRITSNSFSIMVNELSKYSLLNADYVIKPDLIGISKFDFGSVPSIIRKGSSATKNSIKVIKKLIK